MTHCKSKTATYSHHIYLCIYLFICLSIHPFSYLSIYVFIGKLAVTSLPRRTPGSGPVIIETRSGGVGVSSLHYMYASRSPSERVKGDIYNSSPVLNRKLTGRW